MRGYVGQDSVIVALLFWGVQALNAYPSPEFHDFMRSMGAAEDLDTWLGLHTSETTLPIAYGLVGVPNGKGLGIEVLVKTAVDKRLRGGSNEGPYPGLRITVYLRPDVKQLLTPS